jgi:hypothetical protein
MDKNEERVRNTTLAQLWNDEIVDRERIDTGEMSDAEARERAEFWHQAAGLYHVRARQMEAMAKHLLQKTKPATKRRR